MGDLFMEQKKMICFGREITDYEQYYLKNVGKIIVYSTGIMPYDIWFQSEGIDAEKSWQDDAVIYIDFPKHSKRLAIKENSFEIETSDVRYYFGYKMSELVNDGFQLIIGNGDTSCVITVYVDLLNNIDICVGRDCWKNEDHMIKVEKIYFDIDGVLGIL